MCVGCEVAAGGHFGCLGVCSKLRKLQGPRELTNLSVLRRHLSLEMCRCVSFCVLIHEILREFCISSGYSEFLHMSCKKLCRASRIPVLQGAGSWVCKMQAAWHCMNTFSLAQVALCFAQVQGF